MIPYVHVADPGFIHPFGLLVATGVLNLVASGGGSGPHRVTLVVKLVLAALSGVTAWLHLRARTPAGLAAFGALALVTAVGAAGLGVQLSG